MKIEKASVAIVVSEFNKDITRNLLQSAEKTLIRHGVRKKNIAVFWVPGAYEIPFAVNEVARKKKFKAILALGCVIKGETAHDFHIASWVSVGLGQISIATRTPVLFGVLTPNNEFQAKKRSRPGPLNRGKEVAEAAIKMILLQERGWK